MIIRSIRLNNIRSYTDEKIEFLEGSTLLSGDIGSGKSTILMAADFALFGLKKGELLGADLLRHGKNDGFVEMNFECGGKEFFVRRSLKLGKSATQDACSITIDGTEYAMSPTELKSKIMEILGYSDPGKPLFRYTVYTPQEEMKSILINSETRLEVLRNVFEADKYTRIKSNSRILLSEIRSMKRSLDSFSRDLIEKENLLTEKKSLLLSATTELQSIGETLNALNKKYDEAKKAVELMKAGYEEHMKLKIGLERNESDLRGLAARRDKTVSDLEEMRKKVEESASATKGYREGEADDMRKIIEEAEPKREKILARKAVLYKEKDSMSLILEKKFCGVCGQRVGNPDSFRDKIGKMEEEIALLEKDASLLSSRIRDAKDAIIRHHKTEAVFRSRMDSIKWLEKLEFEKTSSETAITALEAAISSSKPAIAGFGDNEKKIMIAENELYLILDERLKKEKLKSRLEQQISDIGNSIEIYAMEIKEKHEAVKKSSRLAAIDQWAEERFMPLMDVIEKNVLTSIQMEFDRFFQQWFCVLMGDSLSVRIDDKFTPIIEQNGYETEYSNLSGGEKTSVALAYRLALNKTINILSKIETKDIIILDEPTDGFSTEQLDRIRDVIAELDLRQIIIVSHEPKIDTFVDNVIRVYKDGHVSRIAY